MSALHEAARAALNAWEYDSAECRWHMDKLSEALAAAEAQPTPDVPETHFGDMAQPVSEPVAFLDCDIAPRALSYSLRDYHRAGIDGPLHYTWTDKPHRLLYDLIAAVRYYAAPAAPAQVPQPLTDAQAERLYQNIKPSQQQDARSCAAFKRLLKVIESAHGIGITKETT